MNGGPVNFPAFWMLSTTHRFDASYPTPARSEPTCLSAELDIFEPQGGEPPSTTSRSHQRLG
jgi:hypothetical protein